MPHVVCLVNERTRPSTCQLLPRHSATGADYRMSGDRSAATRASAVPTGPDRPVDYFFVYSPGFQKQHKRNAQTQLETKQEYRGILVLYTVHILNSWLCLAQKLTGFN